MSYQVIARKWRPQRFSDMVGQEHIARTLKNTIISGRIAHAYLFVGPRGIGKTTTARIFAKALNCVNPIDGEPCCQCSSCKAIANESSVDVIEIDAATHTQVDKAREICEDVLHLPIASKYKIYIIDEVHMLSKSAWNALLKTIEEPPAHAKFIFATTEVNKVLPTVISRCQRFDLRRIHSADIASRLRYIADQEKVNISDSAINVIAHAADGGMRDAQSLMDQLISFFGGNGNSIISEEQALNLFGLTAPAEMEALIGAVLMNDREKAILSLHHFAEQGKNLETLYEEMIAWLRGILLCRILRTPQCVLEESPEKIEVYQRLASGVKPGVLQRLIENLSASGYLLRDAINKQIFIESILLRSMRQAHSVQIEDLIARLNQIRNQGELDPLHSVVPLYEVPVGQIVTPSDSGYAAVRSMPLPAAPAVPAAPAPEPVSAPQPPPPPVPVPTAPAVKAPEPVEPAADLKKNDVTPVPVPAVPEPVPAAVEPEPVITIPDPEPESEPEPEIGESIPEIKADGAEEDGSVVPPLSPESLWQRLILDVSNVLKKNTLAAFMEEGRAESLSGFTLTVAFDLEYAEMCLLMVEKELPLLTARLRAGWQNPRAQIRLVRRQGIATPAQIAKKTSAEELRTKASAEPVVQQVMELFDGRLTDAYEVKNCEPEKS